MIYINKTAKGTSYRMGTTSKAIIGYWDQKLYGTRMNTKMRNQYV